LFAATLSPAFVVGGQGRVIREDAGVVHDCIDLAQAGGFVPEALDRFGVAEVGLDYGVPLTFEGTPGRFGGVLSILIVQSHCTPA